MRRRWPSRGFSYRLRSRLIWTAVRRVIPVRYHRPAAKRLFWLAGELSQLKTWQRSYPMGIAEDGSWTSGKSSWSRRSCALSDRVLSWSMQLDWSHWDHWACVHENCSPSPCVVCGGWLCVAEEEGT